MRRIGLPLLILATVAGCARDTAEFSVGGPQTEYSALGQDPGWALRIDRDQLAYTADGGRTRLSVARPVAIATAGGQRYQTSRLVVDIVPNACDDAISGSGFPDVVIVTAAGRTSRGCGGPRLPERSF